MPLRSSLLAAGTAAFCLAAIAAAPQPAWANPEMVGFSGYSAGTIVVKTSERRLYYVVDGQHALRYPVGVGKAGKQWAGTSRIDGKFVKTAWSTSAEVKYDMC